MKTILLIIIAALLGVIAWFLYQDSQKSPLEKAAEDISETVDGAAREIKEAFEPK